MESKIFSHGDKKEVRKVDDPNTFLAFSLKRQRFFTKSFKDLHWTVLQIFLTYNY